LSSGSFCNFRLKLVPGHVSAGFHVVAFGGKSLALPLLSSPEETIPAKCIAACGAAGESKGRSLRLALFSNRLQNFADVCNDGEDGTVTFDTQMATELA
jgi:hypothetical protein